MTGYREQLASALRAVAVTSPTSYSWFGARSPRLPRAVLTAVAPATARQYLVDALQRELYRSFYTQGTPMPARSDLGVPARADRAFVQALSRANTGSGGWDHGWRVERVEQGTAQVERGGLLVRVRVSDCRATGGRCTAGVPVSLRRPKEFAASAPGFYIALGDAVLTRGRQDLEIRVYFTLRPAGAAPLVAVCTRLLNEAQVPFSLKVLDHPTGFTRCDAAILYLEPGSFERARGPLAAIASACAPQLRRDSPAFAKPLAPGVSVGEHRPNLGASFGSSRCRLVAEGIVAAHERGDRGLGDRLAAVAGRFAEEGLDVEAPYLAPGSSRRYAL
jgi:hypothetical protein